MAATWYGDDSPHLSLSNSQPCFGGSKGSAPGYQARLVENGQNSGEMGGSSPWTRPSGPECGDTLVSSGRPTSDLGWDRPRRRLRGRYRLGHRPVVLLRTEANVKAGKVLRPPIRALPSVFVVTEKVTREADGPVVFCDSTESLLRVETCSPRGAPRKLVG